MQRSLALAVTILAATASAHADSNIVAGHHQLLPDRPGQSVPIQVIGDDRVAGFELYLAMSGNLPLPSFQGVDCYTGTIFQGHEAGFYAAASLVDPVMVAQYGVTDTNVAGDVLANGLLATVTVSTEGVSEGTFDLLLAFDFDGTPVAANFAGFQPTLSAGTIEVIPEPASAALLLTAALGLLRRRPGR